MYSNDLAVALERVDLVISRTFNASREMLFEVWSQPKHLVNWWGPDGYSLPFCEVDFRVGGAYKICMRSPEGDDHWVSGTYREIAEPERIEFTWIREDAVGKPWCDTVVTISFDEIEGRTHFRLYQTGFDSLEHRDGHRGGWSECLERLWDYVTVG